MSDTTTSVPLPVEDKVNFKVDILNLTQTSQIQFGLRLQDYESYRHHCTRRIQKLRKQIRKLYGKKSYISKITNITQQINDHRYLLIMLYKTERAWSYAMDLKKTFEQGENTRSGFHMNRRFSKAAKHATEFEAYCNELSDTYTIVEAKAYATWHRATLLINKEEWQEALEQISISKQLYEGLSKVGNHSLQDLYLKRSEEAEPVIRFCRYNLRSLDNTITDQKLNNLSPSISDSIQKSLKEISNIKQDDSSSNPVITWKSKTIQVENDKLKEKLAVFEQFKKENESKLPSNVKLVDPNDTKKYMIVYDQLVLHLNNCEIILKNDISNIIRVNAKVKTFKSEIEEENLKVMLSYILYQKMKYLYDRNQIVILMFKKSLNGESIDVKGLKGKKKLNNKDLVRMSAHQIKIFSSMVENQDSTNQSAAQIKDSDSQLLLLRSYRLYFISIVTTAEKKFSVTMATMDRIQSNINQIRKQSAKNQSLIQEASDLESQIKQQRSTIHAGSFIEQLNSNEELKKQMSSLTISQDGTKSTDLLSGMDSYDTSFLEEKKLIDYPPQLEPVPVKPLFFDLAFNTIQFPSLEQRKKPVAKGGLFGSFWR